jgi:hypothetical protein
VNHSKKHCRSLEGSEKEELTPTRLHTVEIMIAGEAELVSWFRLFSEDKVTRTRRDGEDEVESSAGGLEHGDPVITFA